MNQINGVDITDTVVSGNFDVIGGGREYDEENKQAVGDLTVPMPSTDVIAGYQEGTLTYEELLEILDVTPVDESTGTNLLTQELVSTQTGIFNGVSSIIELLQQILVFFNNLIASLVQALIDMIAALLLPSDGFIDTEIGKINDKLNTLGIAPYDMSDIFNHGNENPFKNITINIYGQEVVIVSFDYLPQFLDKFRPIIRGLLVLFMLFYSINQLLSLIRLSGMMEGGNVNNLQIGAGSSVPQIADKGGK